MEITDNYKIKGILVGRPGSGKTQASITLPGKKLHIDLDGKAQTLADREDTKVITLFDANPKTPRTWLKLVKLQNEIWSQVRKGTFPYDSIIEDSLTYMLRWAMNWSLMLNPKTGLGDTPAEHHWFPQMYNVTQHIQSMKSLPVHYLLTAHVEYIEDKKEGEVFYLPKATGKMRTEVAAWFNECYSCTTGKDDKGKTTYYWTTSGIGKWDFLTSALNHMGKYWTDPIKIDFDEKLVGFEKLMDLRFKKEKKNE